jgi:DNA-binding transcriptional ArsR family regulator
MLSVPVRLHLLWLLIHHQHDVSTLAKTVGAKIPTVSHHLAKLRLAGLVTARRDGSHHIYTIEDPHMIALVKLIFNHINPDGTPATDTRV